jgi:uncharacterized protein YaaQ
VADPTKLCVIIASDTDAERLLRSLARRGLSATKVASTGGFLRHGSVTLLCGVPGEQVDEVLGLVREECQARTEVVPLHALPFGAEGGMAAEPIEVRLGGAVVFVVDIERFERV